MRFLHPGIGWWLLAALAAAGAAQWALRRRFAASTTVRWLNARTYRASALRRLPFVLLVAALVLLGLALMDPVIPFSQSQVQSRGLDIVMVLDLSSSMEEEMNAVPIEQLMRQPARPPGKTRLEATKEAIKTFIRARRDDRIGLVVFSDHAYVVSPLTFDYEYLTHYVDMVDDRILQGEGQTAIGDGLALANYLLSRQSQGQTRGHQVIVLFTDGENNRGRDPVEVLGESNDANIRVHVVGVDLEREVRDKPQVRRLLQMIAREGGRYFNATSEHELATASQAIDSIEKGSLVSKVFVRDAPVYQWFALPALLCLAAAVALRAIPYFVDLT
jgi:Ca-activated chloride channel family protein